MSPSSYSILFSAALLVVSLTGATAHGTITGVTGANGVQAAGFGIIADTPRDGSRANPFEQDTSVIRDRDINSGKTGACGKTKAGGNNDVTAQLAAASNAGLPTASSTGQLTMTLHQVNQDGAGNPYKCDVSTDGGNTFQPATVATNVPGKLGLSLAKATDFPLVMQVAAGTTCTGGPAGDACIARCRNPALAGPFGSCVAFSMGGAAADANSTASDAAAAAATDSVAAATAADSTAAAATAAATGAAGTTAATGAAGAQGVTGAQGAAGTQGAAGAAAGTQGATGAAAGAAAGTQGATGAAAGAKGAAAGAKGAAAGAGAAGTQGAAGAKGAAGKAGGVISKFLGGGKRDEAPAKKRVIKSRVAGANSGYWLDA